MDRLQIVEPLTDQKITRRVDQTTLRLVCRRLNQLELNFQSVDNIGRERAADIEHIASKSNLTTRTRLSLRQEHDPGELRYIGITVTPFFWNFSPSFKTYQSVSKRFVTLRRIRSLPICPGQPFISQIPAAIKMREIAGLANGGINGLDTH
jgi:hypothetical protein